MDITVAVHQDIAGITVKMVCKKMCLTKIYEFYYFKKRGINNSIKVKIQTFKWKKKTVIQNKLFAEVKLTVYFCNVS